MKAERVVNFFKSPAELQAQAIDSLSKLRQPDLTAFHYISDIPEPPEPYIAHPYTLLQTNLVGRQAELNLLTDWVAKPSSDLYQARILSIVAIGGMGKSALTWKWFNDIAPHEMQPLAGRLWWSFYESDATFENFVIRALAYVSRQNREDIQKLPPPEREEQLLSILDRESFLLVLDGLERILIAYARMDAARLADDDLDQRTANFIAGELGLPKNAAQTFTGQYRLRKAADLRTGAFLRKLATTRSARILISTRLYPADLQMDTGSERFGCRAIFLHGLSDDDALNMWRALGISGSRETLLPVFHTFENHPLLIQALAGEVSHDRRMPGDFDGWCKNHPDFNPFRLPLVQVKSHVLEFAMRGLGEDKLNVLNTIAAFRMPAAYDTLVALLVGKRKPCPSENKLITILADLEDRGLLGWDRRANRYDLHPIVRGVTWTGLDKQSKQGIYETISSHFESLPKIDNWREVNSLEDLTAAIELYNTLIGLERYEDAAELLDRRLDDAMRYALGAYRQHAELLELLFPDGLDQLPRLSLPSWQSNTLHELALSIIGQPGKAATLFRRAIDIDKKEDSQIKVCGGLCNLSEALHCSGVLRKSAAAAHQALLIARQLSDQSEEVRSLCWFGQTLAVQGRNLDSAKVFKHAIELLLRGAWYDYQVYENQAIGAVWFGEYTDAQALAKKAMTRCQELRYERGMICAARLQGEAALGLSDVPTAEERLHHALARARTVNLVEEEIPALVGLAEIRRRQNDIKAAHDLLEDVWEPAERGPFRLFHADAYNVLTQIEIDAGNHEAAAKAAMEAYRLAWCDGPPFAYHWGLQKAFAHLAALGVPEPTLPPFDESKYEPMPEVEIEPSDEEEDEVEIEP